MLPSLKRPRLEQFLEDREEPPPERELLPPRLAEWLEKVDQLHPGLLLPAEQEHVELLNKLVRVERPPQPPIGHRQPPEPPPHVVGEPKAVALRVELREPPPLLRDPKVQEGAAQHREARLL